MSGISRVHSTPRISTALGWGSRWQLDPSPSHGGEAARGNNPHGGATFSFELDAVALEGRGMTEPRVFIVDGPARFAPGLSGCCAPRATRCSPSDRPQNSSSPWRDERPGCVILDYQMPG
jgi:hypothetical protein